MCMTIKEKYIDPFTDFGFKQIFGNENHKNILISFLNDLLDLKYKIISIEYRNLEQLGLNIVDRKAVYDIYCTDEKENNFIVELQRGKQKYFKDRSVYYTSFPIQEQSKKGTWDYSLKKIYFIGILEFELENTEKDKYLSKVQLCDTQTHEVFYNKLTYYYIEMPKFKKTEKELSNHLEYWLYYLNNLNNLNQIPETFKKDKVLNEAFDIAEFLALDEDKKFAYQQDLKARNDYKNVMDYAVENATKYGLEKGLKKGLLKGKIEGEKVGKIEGANNKALEIAKKLLDVLDNETISLKTGLDIQTIKSLR